MIIAIVCIVLGAMLAFACGYFFANDQFIGVVFTFFSAIIVFGLALAALEGLSPKQQAWNSLVQAQKAYEEVK